MKTFNMMTKRNIKMFFKDKAMLLTSLITPVILLVLYVTFLANVYRDSFESNLPEGFELSKEVINSVVSGQLFSSLLAVSCVTVAFCSNLLMVQDKARGTRRDFLITPTKKSTLALSYYVATFATTLIVSLVATLACFVYIMISGWYMSFVDVILVMLDVLLLTLFGTALSSVVNVFLSSNGQASAVGTIVSSGYGFICGAYMPISQFGSVLQKIIMFLPGTYGTSLIRNHTMAGAFREMSRQGVPADVIDGIKTSIDCNLSFFGKNVSIGVMYLVFVASIVLLVGAFVLINILKNNKSKG